MQRVINRVVHTYPTTNWLILAFISIEFHQGVKLNIYTIHMLDNIYIKLKKRRDILEAISAIHDDNINRVTNV